MQGSGSSLRRKLRSWKTRLGSEPGCPQGCYLRVKCEGAGPDRRLRIVSRNVRLSGTSQNFQEITRNGRICCQSRGRPRAGTPADRAGVLRDGGTRPVFAAGIPCLLGKAPRDAGRRRVPAAPAEAETSDVPGVQSTVSDPDPRRVADSELAGTSDQAAERCHAQANSGECPRPREGRRVTVGLLRSPRDRPEDLYHHIDGGRKKRKHG